MVPVDSDGVSRAPPYSGTLREVMLLSRTGLSPPMARRSKRFRLQITSSLPCERPYNPAEENLRGLGCSPFARRY